MSKSWNLHLLGEQKKDNNAPCTTHAQPFENRDRRIQSIVSNSASITAVLVLASMHSHVGNYDSRPEHRVFLEYTENKVKGNKKHSLDSFEMNSKILVEAMMESIFVLLFFSSTLQVYSEPGPDLRPELVL